MVTSPKLNQVIYIFSAGLFSGMRNCLVNKMIGQLIRYESQCIPLYLWQLALRGNWANFKTSKNELMSKDVAPLSGSPPPAASNVSVLCDLSICHVYLPLSHRVMS